MLVTKMPFFLVQVCYLPNSTCIGSDNAFLLAVSCPIYAIDWFRKTLSITCYQCINAYVICLLLVLAEDVELDPGPKGNSTCQPSLDSIVVAISRIESLKILG